MKWVFIFSFMLMKIYFPDTGNMTSAGENSAVSGRYQITETDQPEIWNKRLFLLSQNFSTRNEKDFFLTGFTNHGAGIQGILLYPCIQFPRQSVKVIPEGGDGKSQWTIDMEASGVFHENILELNYRIFHPDSTILSGKIKAEKIQP